MTKQLTREEIKAAKREANQALMVTLRDLVAAGRDDEALAKAKAKGGASWIDVVSNAVERRNAKAAKAAAKAAEAAEAAPVAAPVAAVAAAPVADPTVAALLDQVAALTAAVAALSGTAAAPVVAAPVAAAPVANVFDLPNENAANVAKGLGRKIAGKVDRVLASGDTAAALQALQDARQCAAWCSAARSGEADKATADRLASAERSYDKAAARLNAALGGQ